MKDIGSPVTDSWPNGDSYHLNDFIGDVRCYPRYSDAIHCRQMCVGAIITSEGRLFHNT